MFTFLNPSTFCVLFSIMFATTAKYTRKEKALACKYKYKCKCKCCSVGVITVAIVQRIDCSSRNVYSTSMHQCSIIINHAWITLILRVLHVVHHATTHT